MSNLYRHGLNVTPVAPRDELKWRSRVRRTAVAGTVLACFQRLQGLLFLGKSAGARSEGRGVSKISDEFSDHFVGRF